MLPEWVKAYFRYHRRERNGLLFVMALLMLVITYNVHLRLTLPQRAGDELLRFGPSILAFEDEMEQKAASGADPWSSDRGGSKKYGRKEAERFVFDPNTLDSAGWVRLGFSPKQSASIIRYRSKGGSFRKEEDLLKLFMVDSSLYLELQPFVEIQPVEQKPRPEESRPWESEPAPLAVVDINRADTFELEDIRGIGPAFARRISRYRDRLGGFLTPEQLLEVWGMDTARYEAMLPQVTLDTTVRSRININTADFKELIRHPYLDKNKVRAIIRYREQHGAYQKVEDLLQIHLIDKDDLQRLGPYLRVD